MKKYKILIIAGTDLNNKTNGSVKVLLNYLGFIPSNIEVDIINIGEKYESEAKNIHTIRNIKNDYFLKKKIKFIPIVSVAYNVLEKNKKIKNLITSLNKIEKYDLVYYHDTAILNYCDLKKKSIANFIDLQSQNNKLYYKNEKNILKKLYFLKEKFLCEFFEKKFINKFEKIILVNEKEKDLANEKFKTNKFLNIPIGIPIGDVVLSNKKLSKNINLVFIGNMRFKPNKDGILYFYENYFKKLPENYTLNIVGPNNDSIEIDDQRVKKIGFVNNLDEFLENMDFGIAIMINGAGQKTKILDYLSRGLPTFINNFTYENNYFDSDYIYNVNDFKELIDKIEKMEIIKREEIKKSVLKYSDKNSAKSFWEIIEDTLIRK